LTLALAIGWSWCQQGAPRGLWAAETPEANVDWGGDHVGQSVPEYTTGGECLFCHRDYVGPRWTTNPHNRTMREASAGDAEMVALRSTGGGADVADEAKILLGARNHVRFVKTLPEYGKAAIHSWIFHTSKGLDVSNPSAWDGELFNASCAGCHATAVDPETTAFGSPGLDCYVCHGVLELEHASEPQTVLFGKNHEDDARVVASVCGQCHLRGGVSASTRRPYPNNFVAGDNLVRDFRVDWSDEALAAMDIVDRHVFDNARDVLMRGKTDVTCTTCHNVHADTSEKHKELAESASCAICHQPGKEWNDVPMPKARQSNVCRYGTGK
jgi:hypothetical protein